MGVKAALAPSAVVAVDAAALWPYELNGALPGVSKNDSDEPTARVIVIADVHLLFVVNGTMPLRSPRCDPAPTRGTIKKRDKQYTRVREGHRVCETTFSSHCSIYINSE